MRISYKGALAGLALALVLTACPGVTPDTQPPAVSITSPAEGAVLTDTTVTVTGTASDDVGVVRVTFQVGGGAEQEVAITPGLEVSFSFPVTLQQGENIITVNAYDEAELRGQASRTVVVDLDALQVTITTPQEGQVVTVSPLTVEGEAESGTEVARVTYSLNEGPEVDVPITPAQEVSFSFDIALVAGSHTLAVNAYDAAGNVDTDEVSFSYEPLPTGEIQGNVFMSPSAGGGPVEGAEVTVTVGNQTASDTTAADGSFGVSVNLADAETFSISVVPPPGLGLAATTYADLPLAAYTSPYGAAGELNIHLLGGEPVQLEAVSPHLGCLAGTLFGADGEPVASANPFGRPLAAECNFDNIFDEMFAPPQPGETGIVRYSPFFTAVTDDEGNYLVPFRTGANLRATSNLVWAGNYTGTDTGNLQTADELFWEDFSYIPNVDLFLRPDSPFPAQELDLTLAPFDPVTNPEQVTTLQVAHDTTALAGFVFSGFNANALSYSVPSFRGVGLGLYLDFTQGSRNLRVPLIPSGVQALQIQVVNDAFEVVTESLSRVTNWRDGANLSEPITADFLATPPLQSPQDGAVLTDPSPTLSWQAVAGASIYIALLLTFDAEGMPVPVWQGITTQTAITVPVELEAGAIYAWFVITNDYAGPEGLLGVDPLAFHASHWLDLERHPRLQGLASSPLNEWRGSLAQAFIETHGYVPSALPQAAAQNLLTTGLRESFSQVRLFAVAN